MGQQKTYSFTGMIPYPLPVENLSTSWKWATEETLTPILKTFEMIVF